MVRSQANPEHWLAQICRERLALTECVLEADGRPSDKFRYLQELWESWAFGESLHKVRASETQAGEVWIPGQSSSSTAVAATPAVLSPTGRTVCATRMLDV